MSAAYRFFHIEDIMRTFGYDDVIHIEADNLLYGDLSTILPTLRESYKGIYVSMYLCIFLTMHLCIYVSI
jgi:hypothetical protein